MAEQPAEQTQDMMQLWREWLTQSERQLNAFFNEMMGSETFARSTGASLETFAAFQRLMGQGMERYLSFINVPSRTDIVGLAETLRSIEDRLAKIEQTLQIAAEAVDGREPSPPVSEPRRTRRRPGARAAGRGSNGSPIPEELRR